MNPQNKEEGRPVKWAVKVGSIGLFALRLVESLKDAEGLWNRVVLERSPSRMPVLINSAGGMHSFDPTDPALVEVKLLPAGNEPLTLEERFPKNSKDFKFGWIAPDGSTFRCTSDTHVRCAIAIWEANHPDTDRIEVEKALLDEGWLSVHFWKRHVPAIENPNNLYVIGDRDLMTKQQADTLVELGFDQGNEQITQLIRQAEANWRGEEYGRK